MSAILIGHLMNFSFDYFCNAGVHITCMLVKVFFTFVSWLVVVTELGYSIGYSFFYFYLQNYFSSGSENCNERVGETKTPWRTCTIHRTCAISWWSNIAVGSGRLTSLYLFWLSRYSFVLKGTVAHKTNWSWDNKTVLKIK